jgi:hypothetical protein
LHERWINASFFNCFAHRSLNDGLVRIASTTRNAPGITVMHPRRTMLQQQVLIAN